MKKLGCFLTVPDIAFIEIAADLGYGTLLLDVEHGTFDLKDLDRLIPLARLLGLDVFVKVEGPHVESVQQALDFGANGVVIPHVLGVDHARFVCSGAKYPPLGTRSYAGARTVRYGAPSPTYFEDDNKVALCFPMVETAESLEDVAAILELPTVDGIFIGPSDLSLTRGRGRYGFTDADRVDIAHVAEACKAAGKPWIMPAWRVDEKVFADEYGAAVTLIAEQQGAMATGLELALRRVEAK